MPVSSIIVPSKRRIASAFGRRAALQHGMHTVQAELAFMLAMKVLDSGFSGRKWVDLGCGAGSFRHVPETTRIFGSFTGVDIAYEPLAFCRERTERSLSAVQADIDFLPFKKNAFDGAVAASMLQWLNDLSAALENIASILRHGGLLAFSVFIEGSFRELFSVQSRFGIPVPVRCFETGAFVSALELAGFRPVKYETIEIKVHAPSAVHALKSLSEFGGTATSASRLLNKSEITELCRAYETDFMETAGVPLTYRATLGLSRKES